MSTKNNVHCPKCGHAAAPSDFTRTRDEMEHGGIHSAAHSMKHHPLLSGLVFAGIALSKLLSRRYRCEQCSHMFSA